MTLKLIQGFETCRDDSDLRSQGWMFGTTKIQQAFFPQSQTGVAGTGFKTPFYNATSVATPSVTSGASYFNTGIAVNTLWAAGSGFTFGGAMTFNQNTQVTNFVPCAPAGLPTALIYDNTHKVYVAYDATFMMWTSPDLITWTKMTSQPFANGAYSSLNLSYMGSGMVMVRAVPSTASITDVVVSITSDSGNTFTVVDFGTNTVSSNVLAVGVATGNSTYPHAVMISGSAAGIGAAGIWVGNLATGVSGMTKVISFTTGTQFCSALRVLNGYVVAGHTSGLYSALASNASLNTAGAWSTATTAVSASPQWDVGYVNSNLVVSSTSSLYSVAASTGIPPSGTVTWGTYTLSTGAANTQGGALVTGTNGLYALLTNSTTTAAAGYVLKSTDGVTWALVHHVTADTTAGVATAPSAALTNGLQSFFYNSDTTRYVMIGPKPVAASTGYNCIYSSSDMDNDWRTEFVPDNVELTAPASNFGPLSIWGATVATSATLTITANANAQATISAISAASRTIGLTAGGAAGTGTVLLPNNIPYHYYEIQAVKNTSSTNAFDINLYVDEVLVATKTAVQMAASSDTTGATTLVLCLNTWGQITGWDDLYFTVNDGLGVTGNQGVVNVGVIRPSTDGNPLNWVPVNSALTQSNNLRQPASSSRSDRGLTSFNTGDISVVGTTDKVPTGFKPLAIQFEGYAAKVGNFNSTSTLSIISGGQEKAAPPLTATSTTGAFESQVVETDPNGNIAWTSTSVGAVQFKVTKN